MAVITIGGSNLLMIQSIQNSYKGVNTSQVNIKTENQSTKSLLSMAQIKSSNQSQTKIKKSVMLILYYQLTIVPKIIIFYRFSEDEQRIFSLSKTYKPALYLPLIPLSNRSTGPKDMSFSTVTLVLPFVSASR